MRYILKPVVIGPDDWQHHVNEVWDTELDYLVCTAYTKSDANRICSVLNYCVNDDTLETIDG